MKTTIDHLPDDQQQKLQAITAVLPTRRSRFLSTCSSCLVRVRAAIGWTIRTGYKSDYDLLVVVENEKQVNDLTVWGRSGTEGARNHRRHTARSSFTTSSS